MSVVGTILTAGFDSPSQGAELRKSYLAAASQNFYVGAFVTLNASGYAIPVPAQDGTTDNSALKVVGQCVKECLSTSLGDAIPVRTNTIVTVNNLTGDLVVQADVGGKCYATSDNEVCHTQINGSGKAPVAGTVVGRTSSTVDVYLNANATV